jgi:hypothetical protein
VATWKTVQKICSRLPLTEESTSYGTPAMKVKGKLFARLRDDDGGLVVFTDDKQGLLADDPEAFYTTPHYDGHPIVLVRLPKVSEKELRELLTDSWRLRAPAKVRKDNPDV